MGHIVSFPRQLASAGQRPPSESEIQAASAPGQILWDMQGEFLVAKPDENQSPSDSIIEPLPFSPIPIDESAKLEPEPIKPKVEKPTEPKPVKPDPEPIKPKVEKPAEPKPVKPEPEPIKPKVENPAEPEPVKPQGENAKSAEADIPLRPTPDISKHTDIENKWFYLLGGKEVGPITTKELQELVRSGKASSTVFVWQNGMESWIPIEEIDELNVEPPHEAEGSFTHSALSLTQRTSKLAHNANNLVWMAVTAAFTLVLLFAMRESLMDFDLIVLQTTAAVMGLAMLIGLLVGIWIPLRDLRLFLRGTTTVQMKWLSGTGGLFTCILLAFMIGWQSGRGSAVPEPEFAIKQAKKISDTLVFEKLSSSFNLIDWEHLIVDGEDFGERYRNTPLMDRKLYIMEDVYDVFLSAFDPPYDRQHMRANSLENWHIKVQTVDTTLVSAFCPTSGAKILFMLKGDRLVRLNILPPDENYYLKKEKEAKEEENKIENKNKEPEK